MDVRHFVNGKFVLELEDDPVFDLKAPFDLRQPVQKEKEVPSVEPVAQGPFVVISVGNCPQCEELGAFLAARGVPSSVFVKWDRSSPEYPALKASLQKYAGEVFSFPQVFASGDYQGGFKEVIDKVETGTYDQLFEREFDAVPGTLRRMVEKQAMVVFSLPNCPQCDELRDDLERRKVPVQDVYIKLDKARPEYPALKAQCQQLIGKDQFAFPQTFVRGVYQGNFDEVMAKANQGDYAQFFAEEFGIPMPEKQLAQAPAAVMSFDDDF